MRVFLKGNVKVDKDFYQKGFEVDLPNDLAKRLLANGVAESVGKKVDHEIKATKKEDKK